MINLGNFKIGAGQPCFIAAEVGINHNGDMRIAKEAILQAKKCGASAVKFQNYQTEDFVPDKSLLYSYVSEGKQVTESQYEMFKRYELSFEQLQELKEYCDQQGIIFFSTPTSKTGVEQLLKLNVGIIKNGSDCLGNTQLLKCMAETKLPLIISTGMATFAEIAQAVEVLEEYGCSDLIILRCVSNYPAAAETLNLKQINTLKSFGHYVGFSDHTEGALAAALSVSLGACFIEKHFTIDKNLPGPDHRFSMDPQELTELITQVRLAEAMLGSEKIAPSEKVTDQGAPRREYKLSIAYSQALPAGTLVTLDHFTYIRPGHGLSPNMADALIGMKLAKDVRQYQQLSLADFSN